MATIEKRGPYQWRAKVRKKGYGSLSKTFTLRKDAEAWGRLQESNMERGTFICSKEAENTTLIEALDRYAEEISSKKRGVDMERRRINKWKQHPLATRSLASLRGTDFAKYRDQRITEGAAGNTIRLELAIVSHLFTIARKEWGMESLSNLVQSIRLPKVAPGRDRRLVGDEEHRLLAAARESKSMEIEAIIIIAIETAARRREIFSMKWSFIDLERRTWYIPEDVAKNGVARKVPLSSRAVEVLQKLPRRMDGRVWSITQEHSISQAFDRVCRSRKKDGTVTDRFPNLHFHDLRHEATSRLFELGLDIMEVAAITGHLELNMLKRYTHLRADDLVAKLG